MVIKEMKKRKAMERDRPQGIGSGSRDRSLASLIGSNVAPNPSPIFGFLYLSCISVRAELEPLTHTLTHPYTHLHTHGEMGR